MYDYECLTTKLSAEQDVRVGCSPYFGECYPIGEDTECGPECDPSNDCLPDYECRPDDDDDDGDCGPDVCSPFDDL